MHPFLRVRGGDRWDRGRRRARRGGDPATAGQPGQHRGQLERPGDQAGAHHCGTGGLRTTPAPLVDAGKLLHPGVDRDRVGRKAAMVAAVSLMCVGSLLIAVCPGQAQIGVAAPAILVFAHTTTRHYLAAWRKRRRPEL